MRLFLKFFVSLHTKRPDRLQWLKTMNKLKTIAPYYRVRTFIFTIVSFVIFAFLGCHHGTNNQPEGFKTFWGDRATVFIDRGLSLVTMPILKENSLVSQSIGYSKT